MMISYKHVLYRLVKLAQDVEEESPELAEELLDVAGASAQEVDGLIEVLQGNLRSEISMIHAYWTYMGMLRSLHRDGITKHFEEHVQDEIDHMYILMRRIVSLGGVPVLEAESTKICETEQEALKYIRQLELKAVMNYTKSIKIFEDAGDRATVVTLESLLEKELAHFDDVTRYFKEIE